VIFIRLIAKRMVLWAIRDAQQSHRPRPGSVLKKYLETFWQSNSPECLCNQRADYMDIMGCKWCKQNVELIVDWLQEEHEARKHDPPPSPPPERTTQSMYEAIGDDGVQKEGCGGCN
jgi:hypothetical protein